jgi:uncharacterized membrane protein
MKLPGQRREPRIQEDDEAAGEGIGRILALSDGVFAIAITLLVIQIALPATAGAADLPSALLRLWPRYLAYALSFLVIARFWVSHHLAFRLITRYDSTLVWLNLVLLMFVAFLPFPTAVLGEHLAAPAAAVLYAMAVGLTSAASAGHWWYASGRGRLLKPGLDRLQVKVLRPKPVGPGVLRANTAGRRVRSVRRRGDVDSRLPPCPDHRGLVHHRKEPAAPTGQRTSQTPMR